jgi:hypothetical protein
MQAVEHILVAIGHYSQLEKNQDNEMALQALRLAVELLQPKSSNVNTVPIVLQHLYLERMQIEKLHAKVTEDTDPSVLNVRRRQKYVDHRDAIYDYLQILNDRIALEECEAGMAENERLQLKVSE